MKIMFDTNIILDVLLNRAPFSTDAILLFSQVENGKIKGLIASTTVTTIFYLSSKILGKSAAKKAIHALLKLFEVSAINHRVIAEALDLNFSDFEDAVLYQSACHAEAAGIVTRDPKGFKKSTLPIYTPSELLKSLASL